MQKQHSITRDHEWYEKNTVSCLWLFKGTSNRLNSEIGMDGMNTGNSKFVTSINQLEISCMKHSSGPISKLEGIYYKISVYS